MWNSYNILTFTILRHFRTVPMGTVHILWFFLALRNFWVGTVKKTTLYDGRKAKSSSSGLATWKTFHPPPGYQGTSRIRLIAWSTPQDRRGREHGWGSSHNLFCSRSSLAKSYSLCPKDTAVEPCCLPIWRRSWIPPLSESNVVLPVWKLKGREIGLCLYMLQLILKLS